MSLRKKETVNENLMQSIEQPNYSELLNAAWTKSGGRNKITFDISNLVCLAEYIRAEISQEKYFMIVNQIQQIYEKCSKASMPVCNLICDLRYTYYEPKKSKLFMIYAPVANSGYTSNIVKYLYSLHKRSSVIVSDGNAMNRYREFLESKIFLQKKNKDKNSCCSYNDIYNFLHDLGGCEAPERENVRPAEQEEPKTDVSDNMYFQPVKKQKVTSEKVMPSFSEDRISKTVKASSFTKKKKVQNDDSYYYIEDSHNIKYPINEFPFSMGRDPASDLVVSSPNVSSLHAIIEMINGAYYISDNDSTNGTYIDGNAISCEQITDGSKFSLYDVEMTFHCGRNAYEENAKNKQPQTKTCAVSRKPQDYTAYIQDADVKKNYFITGYPFTSEEIPGVEIIGTDKAPSLRNAGSDTLAVETEKLERGMVFPLYSGCSFSADGKKYIFYMKN